LERFLMMNDTLTPSFALGASPARPAAAAGSGSIAWGGEEPMNPVHQEQAMWKAVIVQALMDAACGSTKYEAAQAREEALIWLRGTSRDFITVCHHAGFEPEFTRVLIQRALSKQCRWRALPGEGTRRRPSRPRSPAGQARQRR
jgi:hypothetical protein